MVWRCRRRKERRVMSEERARKEAPARKMENWLRERVVSREETKGWGAGGAGAGGELFSEEDCRCEGGLLIGGVGFDDVDDDDDDRKAIEALVSPSSGWLLHVDRELYERRVPRAFVIPTIR